MTLDVFLQKLQNTPELVEFSDTLSVIEAIYDFSETKFSNDGLINEAGQNSGSCKLFAFAQLQKLSEEQTLVCFGEYYRDVVKNPQGNDHQNIRHFMKSGWAGISFSAQPLHEVKP